MNPVVVLISKCACLTLLCLGLAHALWPMAVDWPFDPTRAALILVFIHTLELAFVFKHVRSYKGPVALSILLTLLFGLLHWKPLADAADTAKEHHD
jgi:hypothetical protein